MIDVFSLVKAARQLLTDDDTNPEYDRALVELIVAVTNLDRETIEKLVQCHSK